MRFRTVEQGRVLGFDLESKPLAFWFDGNTTAEITAFAWKWTDEQDCHSMLLRRDGRFQCSDGKTVGNARAYSRFAAVIAESDLVFGHNIRAFDLPLLNAGLLRRQISPLLPVLTTDTLKDYPKRKDMSASLENLAKTYGLGDDGGKIHMAIADWELANQLAPAGLDLARARVVSDVLLQEALRDKLLELGLLRPPRRWAP